jgi:hypothetical protein
VIVKRSKRLTLTFTRPFSISGISRPLSPGKYELVPDDELTDERFSPAYRPVVTLLFVPSQLHRCSSVVKVNVDPADIFAAHRRDNCYD